MQHNVLQVQDRVEVNGKVTTPALLGPPPANASHGALFYNKTRAPVGWYWGNETLDVTAATMLLSGPSGGTLRVVPQACPVRGCNVLPPVAADIRWVELHLPSTALCGYSQVTHMAPSNVLQCSVHAF